MTEQERKQKIIWLSRLRYKQAKLDFLELQHQTWDERRTRMTKHPEYFKAPIRRFLIKEDPDSGCREIKENPAWEKLSDKEKKLNAMPPITVHGSGSKGTDQAAIIDKLDDINAKHDIVVEEAKTIEKEIQQAIDRLDNEYEKEVLEYCYLIGMEIKDASRLMHFSYCWTKELHNRALTNIRID